ncbi:MAG: nickel-dependent hydrogenase large subunit, partial [Desulfovibrio sp.]
MAQRFPEASEYGRTSNFFDYADFYDVKGRDPYFNSGVLWKNDFKRHEKLDVDRIEEHVARSWYEGDTARKPYDGATEPMYTSYEDEEKYSWSKAPRYKGEPMETGALARRAIAYARGEEESVKLFNEVLGKAKLKPSQMFSTMGRTSARVIETLMLIRRMKGWIDELEDRIKSGDGVICKDWKMKSQGKGVGYTCVTRGGLSHWLRIEDGRIGNFQMVVPSTWNFGPRCKEGKIGPCEESLIGCPVPDPARPVEILRTVHSFDPCIACSVHLVDARGKTLNRVRVL